MATTETATAVYEKGRLYTLPIGNIQPDPNQPRKYFDQEGLAELSQSIADKGVLQPILVRVNEGNAIVLVAGERRLMAAQAAGLTEIPALFVDENPAEVALIENSLRENLTAVEEAEAAGRLITELNYTQAQVAKILGKKQQTVNDILSLNRLPAQIRDECRVNPVCPRRVLVEIARKKQERSMLSLYAKYKEKGLTSDEVRQAAKREKTEKTPDELAADLITGISALLSRLEKVEWFDISSDGRTHIQEAFATLDEAITTRINSRNLA
ncbi:MAG: ParB/RepB/Spo0J family partition protein [Deltaproteobacteria bacterium]|nr:ParB/RepB/Spo0J family partition protein [Deltaproteobacteria bacterium]